MKRVAMCAAVALLSLPLFAQFTTTTGDTTTQSKVGIGLGTGVAPAANLDIGAGATTTRFLLSGAEYFSSSSSNSGGLAFLLGVNRTGNRQLWIADSDRTASSSSNTVLRLMVFPDYAAIDAVSTSVTTKKLLVLGNAGNVEIANAGKVGINTNGTAPLSLLHIKSTGSADIRLDGGSSADIIQPNAFPMNFSIAGSAPMTFSVAGTENMRIAANGNVGIGTNSPVTLLHLAGSAHGVSPYLLLDRPSTTADAGLIFRTATAPTAQWTMGKAASTGNEDLAIGYGDFSLSNQRMVFTAGGNVGIGRATPLAKLDVNGSIRGNSHLGFLPWTNVAPVSTQTGYVRLLTPIVKTEINAFTLHIVGYRYNPAQSIDIRCSGSALLGSGLQAATCTSLGTDLPIQMTSETVGSTGYVVVRIGYPTTTWTYDLFSVEYEGEVPHDASGFVWSVASTVQEVTNINNVSIQSSGGGSVVIGQPTAVGSPDPTERLTVHGSVVVDGNIGAKYQDVAEWVPVATKLTAGTVVIVSPNKRNEVMASTHAYDTAIAGVVSAQPGLILGEGSDSKAKIATTGRVKVHVDATKHPVKAGDLLVTGDKPGTAMLSEPIDVAGIKLHRPGTLVGKALEPLESGEGDILVLLSLQ